MSLVFVSSESFDGGSLIMRRARQGDEYAPSVIVADFYIGDAPRTVTLRAGDPSALANIGAELREDLDGKGPDGVNTHWPIRIQQTGTFSIAVAREALTVAIERLVAALGRPPRDRSFITRAFGEAKLVARCALLLEQAAALGTFKGSVVP